MVSMSPYQPASEQTAGLSTGESDSSSMSFSIDIEGKQSSTSYGPQDDIVTAPSVDNAAVRSSSYSAVGSEKQPPGSLISGTPTSSKKNGSKRGLFKLASKPKSRSRQGSHDSASLSQSLTNSAPTILIKTPFASSAEEASNRGNNNEFRAPIRSAMSARTLHESLHRGRSAPGLKAGTAADSSSSRPARGLERSVSFANVNIREYERVLGDNPSVTSGPPLSLGWRYVPETLSMNVDDYEDGKGEARSSSEYLVPKTVREKILQEHADVTRREMVAAVRTIQKEKAQRRKTVVNLSMQKTEEKVEGAKRKVKKILKPSTSYEVIEAQLWDEAHAIAMEKAKRLEESIRRGEKVSQKDMWAVGTPCDIPLLPSRRNSVRQLEGLEGMNQGKKEGGGGITSKSSSIDQHDIRLQQSGVVAGGGFNDQHLDQNKSATLSNNPNSSHQGKHVSERGSYIVAEESENDEIFAKLLLDDSERVQE